MRLDLVPPSTALIDQQGTLVSLADLRGQPALITVMLVGSRGHVEWRIDGGGDRIGETLRNQQPV